MNWVEALIAGASFWLAIIWICFIIAVLVFAARQGTAERFRREKQREEFRKAVIDSVLAGIQKENDKFKPPKGPLAS